MFASRLARMKSVKIMGSMFTQQIVILRQFLHNLASNSSSFDGDFFVLVKSSRTLNQTISALQNDKTCLQCAFIYCYGKGNSSQFQLIKIFEKNWKWRIEIERSPFSKQSVKSCCSEEINGKIVS